MTKFELRLYVAGRTAQSLLAIENLNKICESELAGRCAVDVVDVLEHPALAAVEKILATPTLVRRLPEPIRQIIGDLSDPEKVMVGLGLSRRGGTVIT